MSAWSHRYSANAQRQVGELWALLSAGCDFEINDQKTDDKRLCITVLFDSDDKKKVANENGIYEYDDLNTYFLPQPETLVEGRDWY